MDCILHHENRLNGAMLATIRIRPLRLAYLVPDDDMRTALRAIDSCCLTWGGMLNPLIPYSKTKGLSPGWLRILRKFDPDNLVDCVGISETDKQQFTRTGQHVHRWDKPLESFFTVGALQYSALTAFAERLLYDNVAIQSAFMISGTMAPPTFTFIQPNPSNSVIQPELEPHSNPLYPPLIARFGRLDERFLDHTITRHYQPQVSNVHYTTFANVIEADFSGETDAIVLGLTPSGVHPDKGGSFSYYKLPQLTRLGLSEESPPYRIGGGSPEDPQHEEAFTNTVIVTGKENSVSDLCLYWNLRMERLFAMFFPLWIPLKSLSTVNGLKIVQRALSMEAQTTRSGLTRKPRLYLVSSSVSKHILEQRLKDKLETATFETNELDRFISGKWDFYLLKQDREVFFTNGGVRVPIPYPEALNTFGPQDRVVHEVTFHPISLPVTRALGDEISGTLLRLTKRGFAGFSYVSSWPDMITINIPDNWTVLQSVLADAGYNCEPSDKSKFALGLLNLMGSIEDLRVVASSKVYDTLKEMCRIRGQKGSPRAFFAEREVFDYSNFKRRWNKQTDIILGWLIHKGIIFRGISLRCPKCQLTKWYELDKANRTWHCEGCLTEQAIPLELNNATWKYRINELYAMGHDQGATTHLLSMYTLRPVTVFGNVSTLGYYPGVRITAMSKGVVQQTGIEQMELDLVSITDGRLIIAECKDSGERLAHKEIRRYVRLANHLQCSRLIFITVTSFPQADHLFATANQKCSGLLEWRERQDLFDISASERAGGGDEIKLSQEQKAAEYLNILARILSTQK